MRITESFSLALKNIASSKVRTLLTMLGIIIGVAAVIVIVGLGSGLENYIADSFSSMGTNTLTVTVQAGLWRWRTCMSLWPGTPASWSCAPPPCP